MSDRQFLKSAISNPWNCGVVVVVSLFVTALLKMKRKDVPITSTLPPPKPAKAIEVLEEDMLENDEPNDPMWSPFDSHSDVKSSSDYSLAHFTEYLKKQQDDTAFIQRQLDAEKRLRSETEASAILMEAEIEKLHRSAQTHYQEMENLKKQLQQAMMQLELYKTATAENGTEAQKKVDQYLEEFRREHSKTLEELLALREKNKHLLQANVHEKQEKEALLKENKELKQQLEESSLQNPDQPQPQPFPLNIEWHNPNRKVLAFEQLESYFQQMEKNGSRDHKRWDSRYQYEEEENEEETFQ
eukprot:TRINITY_DN9057_c1_g3_i1.p1 TRINITY_DN9057_c1_g3~~TRINITY_DN9057_c1_g3_i1.p1  ORF type:complete len:300 (+),score=89.44 TRINITY_DN9057_c1_g3_i1:80-979(+)